MSHNVTSCSKEIKLSLVNKLQERADIYPAEINGMAINLTNCNLNLTLTLLSILYNLIVLEFPVYNNRIY